MITLKEYELLKLENVTKMYTQTKGIKNINLTINENEIHGLIGLNGAGKTSIIKTILNIIKHESGAIYWDKQEVMPEDTVFRKRIGYVPDDEVVLNHLTPIEILEFVGFSYGIDKDIIAKRSKEILNLLHLEEMNVNVNSFSRGMKKKVQLASALLSNPKLLILDEPIAGFDPNVIFLLKQLLRELKQKGTSMLISTHDLGFAQEVCDKVSFIKEGEILLTGTIDELLKFEKCNSLEELFISKNLEKSSRELLKNVVDNL